MDRLLSVVVGLLLSAVLTNSQSQRYIVPEAKLDFRSPKGLQISIPDIDKGVSLVAFHININEEFYSLEHGHFAADIIKKREGRWTYIIPDFNIKQGDTIYYWIYVIVDNLGYHGLDRVYKVTEANPHGTPVSGSTPKPTITTTTITTTTFTTTKSPNRYPEHPPSCQPSLSSRNGGISACQGQVILNKKFDNIDGWSHEVLIGGRQPDDEFMVLTKDPETSWIDNGNLLIKPKLLEEKYNDEFVRTGTLNLEGCTSNVMEECSRTARSFLILPPVMSARLTTKSSFSFCYGTVEIKAKLPQGDWIVPELWLEPKVKAYGERSGRVVIALARGNVDFQSADSNWLLDAGVIVNNTAQLGRKTSSKRWSSDYHTFKLTWTQDEMVFSVDGEEIHRLPASNGAVDPFLNNGKISPFDREFYITLGVHVAGVQDFSDNMQHKPWKNSNPKRFVQFWESKNVWHTSWSDQSALRVQSVKVTAI